MKEEQSDQATADLLRCLENIESFNPTERSFLQNAKNTPADKLTDIQIDELRRLCRRIPTKAGTMMKPTKRDERDVSKLWYIRRNERARKLTTNARVVHDTDKVFDVPKAELRRILSRKRGLNEWERGFVESINNRLFSRTKISLKQLQVIKNIAKKVGGGKGYH
jgi:hypothetical protein